MINLDTVSEVLVVAEDEIQRLHGIDLDDGDSIGNRKQWAAEVTRDLLALADSLDLAAALVRNQYWQAKGYPTVVKGGGPL